jgi:hypothetical protein
MAKDAFYFSHDSNARLDEKILMMRSVYDKGYGWYWILVEMMRDANAYRLQCDGKYWAHAIAPELRCDAETAEKFIHDCIHEFKLFMSQDGFFWSESLLRRMLEKEAKSLKAKKSANERWGKKMRTQSDGNANASKNDAIKEKKVKESINTPIVPIREHELQAWLEAKLLVRVSQTGSTGNHLRRRPRSILEKSLMASLRIRGAWGYGEP